MKYTIDYSRSETPAADAVRDIEEYMGARKFAQAEAVLRTVADPRQFGMACSFAGVEGAPVRYWYDRLRGDGAYDRDWSLLEAAEAEARKLAEAHA